MAETIGELLLRQFSELATSDTNVKEVVSNGITLQNDIEPFCAGNRAGRGISRCNRV
jgi:hypothetical protein